MKEKYTLWGFYPMKMEENEEFSSKENTWQWKYFGWFESVCWWTTAKLFELKGEEPMFIIKVKD